jgi:osmotically inducible protein OsmC
VSGKRLSRCRVQAAEHETPAQTSLELLHFAALARAPISITTSLKERDMTVSKAKAEWKGNLKEGGGRIAFGTGLFEGAYGFKTRTEGGRSETTPEELIAAAHAACFSMALSGQLTRNNTPPTLINTEATVRLKIDAAGLAIDRINLVTRAQVPGIAQAKFLELAETAKRGCPVSKALAAVDIHLDAALEA